MSTMRNRSWFLGRLLGEERKDGEILPVCLYVALAVTGLYLLTIVVLKVLSLVKKSATINIVNIKYSDKKPDPEPQEAKKGQSEVPIIPMAALNRSSSTNAIRASNEETKQPPPEIVNSIFADKTRAVSRNVMSSMRSHQISVSHLEVCPPKQGVGGMLSGINTLETNQDNANGVAPDTGSQPPSTRNLIGDSNHRFPAVDFTSQPQDIQSEREPEIRKPPSTSPLPLTLPSEKPKKLVMTACTYFMRNHSILRLCSLTPLKTETHHTTLVQDISILYVTIIGMFLTAGIYLDISCSCSAHRDENCCSNNKYVVSVAGVPFLIALFWLLGDKFGFVYFLSHRQQRESSKKKRKHIESFGLSTIICIVTMFVIVIAGITAVSMYSFKFDKKLSLVWLEMVILSVLIELLIFDCLFIMIEFAVKKYCQIQKPKPNLQREMDMSLFAFYLSLALIGLLMLPILICFFLKILLKRFRFRVWPVSFLCYSHIKIVYPCTEYISAVITIRHLSISIHMKKPFFTFRIRGMKVHFVQYNLFKDHNMSRYVNDLKTRFLVSMKEKLNQNEYNAQARVEGTGKMPHGLFEKIEGIIEELDVQFVDVKSQKEKEDAIVKYYNAIDRNPEKIYGDFNIYVPVANLAFSLDDNGQITATTAMPLITVRYRLSRHISNLNNTTVTVGVQKTVSVSVETKEAYINMFSVELHKLIFFVVDFILQDSLAISYNRYTRLAQLKAAQLHVIKAVKTALTHLTVKAGPIKARFYGTTFKPKEQRRTEYKFPGSDMDLSIPKFSLSYDVTESTNLAIVMDTDEMEINCNVADLLKIPQLKQVIAFKEERNEYGILETFSLSYQINASKIEGKMTMSTYQWILSFILMALKITTKAKIRHQISGMLANDYNSLHTSEEDRIKEAQEDMEINVLAEEVSLDVESTKGAKALDIQGKKITFNVHDDVSMYDYTTDVGSLIILAEQHRKLPVVKLKQTQFMDRINKLDRKHSTCVQSEEMYYKFLIPMYFDVFEEICEYVIWSKLHFKLMERPTKASEEFYRRHMKKEIPLEFSLLEIGVVNFNFTILFSNRLVYTVHISDLTNVAINQLHTPINMRASKLTVDLAVFEKKADSKMYDGLVGSSEEQKEITKSQFTIAEVEDLVYYQVVDKEITGERSHKTKFQAKKLVASFPSKKFHIGSAIYKYNYYIRFILKYSRKYYNKLKRDRLGSLMDVDEIAEPPVPFGYELEIGVHDVCLVSEEDIVAKALANKYDISKRYGKYIKKTAAEASKMIMEILKGKSQEKGYCTTHMVDLVFQLKKPAKYKNYYNVYEYTKQLDEAKDLPPLDSYKFLSYTDMILNAKYAEILIRNYDRPIVCMDNVYARYLMILSYFKNIEEVNFMRPKKEFLYNSYLIEKQFIDIPKKLFYDMQFSTSKIELNIQGINTFSEILSIYKKYAQFEYKDYDFEQNENFDYHWFLNVTGLSLYRYLMHGKSDVQINKLVINLFPSFNHPAEKPHLIVAIARLDIKQNFYEVSLILKNLVIEKDKLHPNETALLCIPQIEAMAIIVFNNNPQLDHYLHYGVKSRDEFQEKINQFNGKITDITLKLNVASFYIPEDFPHSEADAVEDIIEKALSMHIHYQYSYLPLIIETIDALTQYSITLRVLDKENRKKVMQQVTPVVVPYKLTLNVYAFFNDLYCLVSDTKKLGTEDISAENPDESPPIENIYDGFVLKIQACGVRGAIVFSNMDKEVHDSLFERAEALIEQLYLGCMSNEMLQFLWKGHLNPQTHKERLLNFYNFFNYDPSVVAPSVYFTIFPEFSNTGSISLLNSTKIIDQEEERFSSTQIYLKIPEMKYIQNKEIDFDFINAKNSKLMIPESGTVEVEHFFSMKTMQALFTKYIGEKFVRHLVQNIDIQKFRKGNRLKLSKQAEQAIASSPLKDIGQFRFHKKQEPAKPVKQRTVPAIAPVIELQTVISIDIPQINIQNELKKSQAIVTTGERICVLIYDTYIKEQNTRYWIQKTGWTYIPSLKCYLAPTNLYKKEKTMWLSFKEDKEKLAIKRDLMETIMYAKNNEIIMNVMNPEFYDMLKPMLSLDIKLQDVDIYTDSTNWWKFMDILDTFIFDRGQKEEEEREGETLKRREVTEYNNELLTNIIYQNLTKTKEEKKTGNLKYIRKKITYGLNKFNLLLMENGVKFAIFRIEKFAGSHIINNDMESEINMDVHKFTIENYVDSDQFRVVLCPLLEGDMKSFEGKDSMLKLRIKDGFAKGLLGSPWGMYDQFELYLFPINFKVTKNFYRRLKTFFIPTTSIDEIKNDPVYRQKDDSGEIKPYAKLIEKEDRIFRSVLEPSPSEVAKTVSKEVKMASPSPIKPEVKSRPEQEVHTIKKIAYPCFFKYLRLNEITTNLTYSSGLDILNIENIRSTFKEYVVRYKFWSFADLVSEIESHMISCAIKQIPSIIWQNIVPNKPAEAPQNQPKNDDDAKIKLFGTYAKH